ncbi:Uncharacterized protein FWK35_00034957 [Aphis craccivora]|uniref:Uncharacterized protein n=1 Tax=Aphis craccivora TaxID=307492 RepID=A0A6G0YA24_APHCR|nr:Uncharacterized protein FWK35_00034957 [Aphis craccivora]
MAHGTRMNERRTVDRSGPPDVVGDESSRYFRKVVKYVIFRRSHWLVGRQCRHIVDAESSKHLPAAAANTDLDGGYAIPAKCQPLRRAGRVNSSTTETDFGYFDRDEI